MTILSRRSVLTGGVTMITLPTRGWAQGADWPKGPIRVVVPFPPGGTTDPVARLLAAKVSENTGWQTVIDNKPGAAGAIGAAIAAKAPPDGMTWMITFDSHVLSPAFTPNLVLGVRLGLPVPPVPRVPGVPPVVHAPPEDTGAPQRRLGAQGPPTRVPPPPHRREEKVEGGPGRRREGTLHRP